MKTDLETELRNGREIETEPYPESYLSDDVTEGATSQVNESRIILSSEVQERKVVWLWRNRVPEGAVTVLDGLPGTGKTALALDMCARVTQGAPWPDDESVRESGAALYYSHEDSSDVVLKPRARAAGADESLLAFPTNENLLLGPGGLRVLEQLRGDMAEMRARTGRSVKLIVFDVLASFAGGANMSKNEEMRGVLSPLARFAEQEKTSIVLIRHFRKGAGDALSRGAGTIGITGAARSVLATGKHPQKEGYFILAHSKTNWGLTADSYEYRLVPANGCVLVEYGNRSSYTADELAFQEPGGGASENTKKQDEARSVILDTLGDGGSCSSASLAEKCRKEGISQRTYERARMLLKKEGLIVYRTEKDVGGKQKTCWYMVKQE